jgi:hypothetical protein
MACRLGSGGEYSHTPRDIRIGDDKWEVELSAKEPASPTIPVVVERKETLTAENAGPNTASWFVPVCRGDQGEFHVLLSLFPPRSNVYTQEDLDWAELVTLDLAKFDSPEGKRELVDVLIRAVREKGFFYVKNFGIGQERVDRQFALGREFYELDLDEKLKYKPAGLGASRTQEHVDTGSRSDRPGRVQRLRPRRPPHVHGDSSFRWPRLTPSPSIDEGSGLRDRVEIYNMPSAFVLSLTWTLV